MVNFNLWMEVKVDSENLDRGLLLIIVGEKDHTILWVVVNVLFKREECNVGVIEIVQMFGRGHVFMIDAGWREVVDAVLEFVRCFI